ncbi:MAG: LuxR C-terminal-related transcriptional regulator [Acidimicrobiales bacterium]
MVQLRRPSGSIVGRSQDVRGVRAALDQARLVNLVGPGGVGKTALAAELINELEPDFDRLVLVELVEAGDGDVPRLVAVAALDDAAADLDRSIAALGAEPTLLVFDNCEHVIDEVAEIVSAALRSTSDLTVLATSRRPLEITEETTWTVEPLGVPTGHLSNRDLTSSEAAQLFLERVRQSVPTFELTDANRPMVAEICVAADGVPLVLELAAALVRNRPLDEILRAMTERPTALTAARRDRPEHQRSLAASLDWSRRFLSEADARLLNRLSVFVGGFTYEAARHVAPERIADGLARLVEHSLVGFDPTTERYRMLEVVRLDAEDRLNDGELTDALRGHLDWCLVEVSRIEAARYERDPNNVFPRFECELPNLGSALRRCHEAGDLDGFRALVGPIAVWWVHYVAPEDPAVWEKAFDGPGVPPVWKANVTSALSFYWSHRGRHREALEYAVAAAGQHEAAGALISQALDETAAGNAHLSLGQFDQARAAYERGLDAAVASGHPYPELVIRVSLARLDPTADEASAQLTKARPLIGGFGAIEAAVTTELGLQALRTGRRDEARELCQQGLEQSRQNGYGEVIASSLCGRAEVAVADGDDELAGRLYDEALTIGRRAGHQGVIDRAAAGLDRLPAGPGPTRSGAGLTGAAGAPAQAGPGSGAAEAEAGTEAGPEVELSDRELSVARLLRGDLTQREIADELYIAPSTVKTHIKSIYRKLGVTKRSYAVTRAAELGLFD